MSQLKTKYGTGNQAITITLASLASAGARESTAVDNSAAAALFLDVLVQVAVKTHATNAPTGDKACYVYVYGTSDPGTPTWPDTVTGTDAGITLTVPTQLRLLGVINCAAANVTYKSEPMSVAAAFGGQVPAKWGIVVVNATGQTLNASGSSAWYQGVLQELKSS